MDFFLKIAQTILLSMLFVIFFTSVASFFGIDSYLYAPFMLYAILLLMFRLFL